MKNKYIFFLSCLFISFFTNAQVTTVPSPPEANAAVTINFNKAGTPSLSAATSIYAHIGVTVDGIQWQNVKGSWGNNTTQPQLTLVSGTTFKLDITPDIYTYFGVPASSSITQICVVFRNAAGNAQSADTFINVGAFQSTLSSPAANSTTILQSGNNLNITATNTNGDASYNLFANGSSITTYTGSSFAYNDTGITVNKSYDLQITQGATTFSKKFSVIINPGVISEVLPANVEDGINYSADATKATLVLTAPGKDFIYVAGSFNNWQPAGNYAMKKDPVTGKFWLEISGLVPGEVNSYQYWVVDQTPIANSPSLVKTADPYSTLVLSPFDDQYISAVNYPNLPPFPAGQEREVTVLQTAQPAYNWQVPNFTKPSKDNLVVYEVLIRDFDSHRSFQDLIDKIDYFKNLKINAIELMPVMEFEGDESWGYNTAFHLALDKTYGPGSKLKELIDLCHQNGIAVILDVALNHAFGRNPMDRMWMSDPDGDGWGGPATDNPYFNVTATHSYSVGNDFNHTSTYTKYYVKRVIKQWIQEFKIDGFRWDLTKGFTQNCAGSETCTNQYQQDRVDVLKEYADYSWSLDPTHYTIFEHLGVDNEEKEWANYRINETPSKGIMMWGNVNNAFNQLSMGYNTNADISRIGHLSHSQFAGKRVMGYAESHDEERLMYKNLQNGSTANAAHNVKTLSVALSRMSAIGAMSILVPGPKMIWHFGDLGWDSSIFTCNNGTVNTSNDAIAGDCKLDTKPQPQWTNNWLADLGRNKIYSDWAKMINMKIHEPVFSKDYSLNSGNNFTQRLYVYDSTNSIPATQLRNVVVLANFNVISQSVVADFPYTGTWYNLMDNTSVTVTNTAMGITIAPGQFRVYGNKQALLGIDDVQETKKISLSPNPSSDYFTIDTETVNVQVFSITGQLVKNFRNDFTSQSRFDISDLKNGVYIVKAIDGSNREATMKLLKQ